MAVLSSKYSVLVSCFTLMLQYLNTMNKETSSLVTKRRQSAKTRIVLADDHPLLRKALKDLLAKEADVEIVGEAGDGQETGRVGIAMGPDMVIIGIMMLKMGG